MTKLKIAITFLIIVLVLSLIWFFAQRRHSSVVKDKISIERNVKDAVANAQKNSGRNALQKPLDS
jgi:preprotein translocase subunit YajC